MWIRWIDLGKCQKNIARCIWRHRFRYFCLHSLKNKHDIDLILSKKQTNSEEKENHRKFTKNKKKHKKK